MTHSADECPTANASVRKLLSNESQEVTRLAAKVGVKFLIGPPMGATNHQSYAVVEAPNIETITDLMFIGPQGVLDVANMTGLLNVPFAGLTQVGRQVRLQWVIYFPWNRETKKFEGEIVYSIRAID